MAKVKMLSRYASPTKVAAPGETIDVSKEEAKELVAAKCAEHAGAVSEESNDGSQKDSSADAKPDSARGSKKAS